MIPDKKKIRDMIRFLGSLVFFFLYIPHICIFCCKSSDSKIKKDVESLKRKINIGLNNFWAFLYLIHNNRYFRSWFYYRIGPIKSLLIGWWRPGDRYFQISATMEIGEGITFVHPYSTIINAERIGRNFNFIHLLTIGTVGTKRPVIGDNVTLGAAVTIIGDVKIGNNVIIGAGSVVVKDLPDNCIAAGNPAKIIRYL